MADPERGDTAALSDLILKFDRIGRPGSTPQAALTLHVPAHFTDSPDRVAEVVYRHAGRYLASSSFGVSVDLEAGTVSLDGGRFGRATILTTKPT